nr:Gfo/Idh/MocA family oxidoreductase [Paracoccus suum]
MRILVVGLGHMGASHADAYHRDRRFEIVGLVARGIHDRPIPAALADYPRFADYGEALAQTRPDAVSISTWPDTHAAFALAALDMGAHVFVEKPIATTTEDARAVAARAAEVGRVLLAGYILRVHPSWQRFVQIGQGLGKPLVMRMNLNQQSTGEAYVWHRNLLGSLTPLVDCGVHYVDVMCQLTGARPLRVHGIGARLWDEGTQPNYGALHVVFDDGSVGWYEAGWGPMMSEVAHFVKDVVGPRGAVSLVPAASGGEAGSADIDSHTRTDVIRLHHAETGPDHRLVKADETITMEGEPDHQALCDLEATLFADCIDGSTDSAPLVEAALNSLAIVLAADQSIREGRAVTLD